jgi:hypothetical protein
VLVLAGSLALAGAALADVVGNSGNDLRNGWYPDQASITPQLVSGGTFGQLWSADVDGQVYAQPLLSNGTLVVATETDHVYGLDPTDGHQLWTKNLAPNGPWNPADVGCSDLQPWIGTTATPVIDSSTNTVYLTHKTYDDSGHAEWFMDALDVTSGQERTGFPVPLNGTADNDPFVVFHPQTQQQRTGLLLMNGVVYAGFGSHCDADPFNGWVFGVSTTQAKVTARWSSVIHGDGGGVWQAGVGLTSDRPGSILLATGNGGAPTTPAPGSSPPESCGECVMRLNVQSDGTLKPVDFFAPFDAAALDDFDADFASGGVVGLPDQYFGTTAVPHLAVAIGKEGYVYLLDRDNLGGYEQGSGGGDGVVQRLGPFGGVWGRAGVWPGDGGYVYIPTSSGRAGGGELDVYKYGLDGSGNPSLGQVAHSSDVFGFGSGSPVITSDGTTSGTALVWIIWSADRQGDGGQLRVYDPLPVNGQPHLRNSWPIGTATNYSLPGVGAGRLYVGTRDGHVLGFGSPVTQALSGSAVSFPATTVGSSRDDALTLTANQPVTITSITSSESQFHLTPPSLPVSLQPHDSISVPIRFSPGHPGLVAGQVTVATTDAGEPAFSVSGTGQAAAAQLDASSPAISLGGTSVGGHLSGTITFTNDGAQALTIQRVLLPGSPFSVPSPPQANDTIAPGASITVEIDFAPTTVGSFHDTIEVDSTGGNRTIGISASAGTPGQLQYSSEALDFGTVAPGSQSTRTFTITNAGGTTVTINRSKPPFGGAFTATTSLPEGTTIGPGQTLTESVTFSPTAIGPASGTWQLNGDDVTGAHQVQFTGTGGFASSTAAGSAAGGVSSGPSHGPGPSLPRAPRFQPSTVTMGHLAAVRIAYTAKLGGVSRFVLQRAVSGRRGAHGCVAANAANRSRPGCTRFITVTTFIHRGGAGANRLRLGAFVALRRLVAGQYRLKSILLDSAGGPHTYLTSLRIKPAPRHASRRAGTMLTVVLADLLGRLSAAL